MSARLALPNARHSSADNAHTRDLSTAAVADLRQTDAHATVVPRPAGVTDGRWDKQDQAAVDLAIVDAQKSVKKRSASQPGINQTYLAAVLGQQHKCLLKA